MRINVYDEELTGEVTVVTKTADTGLTFWGVRVFLASPDVLHNTADDDDRSAITFWVHHQEDAEEAADRLRAAARIVRRHHAGAPR